MDKPQGVPIFMLKFYFLFFKSNVDNCTSYDFSF